METIINLTTLKGTQKTITNIDNSFPTSKYMLITQSLVTDTEGTQTNLSLILDTSLGTKAKQLQINDIILDKREIDLLIDFLSQES